MTDFLNRVREFAAAAHDGQRRKYTGEPYILHPIAVARLVESVGLDEEVVAAALLHDVIEDTQFGYVDIWARFGQRVADLVNEVTDVSKPSDGNRAVRKALDREHLAKASPEGMSIKLADLIDNTKSITIHDPDFARVYMREKKALISLLRAGNVTLFVQAEKLVLDFFSEMN